MSLRRCLNIASDGADVTRDGRLFQKLKSETAKSPFADGGEVENSHFTSPYEDDDDDDDVGLRSDIAVGARGLRGGTVASDSGKATIFGQTLHFSGRSQQPKVKKYIYISVFIRRKNRIHSVQ